MQWDIYYGETPGNQKQVFYNGLESCPGGVATLLVAVEAAISSWQMLVFLEWRRPRGKVPTHFDFGAGGVLNKLQATNLAKTSCSTSHVIMFGFLFLRVQYDELKRVTFYLWNGINRLPRILKSNKLTVVLKTPQGSHCCLRKQKIETKQWHQF